MKKNGDVQLELADKLLFMPDLFSFFLTGVANNEYCIASTSEMLDARKRTWNYPLIDSLGLPERLFGEIVMPGTVRGKLKADIAEEIGMNGEVDVVAVGSHDTASAVFAVPAVTGGVNTRKAFLSSGTWSLLGVELDEPILTEEARLAGFTNEGGVGGKIRFLQNITGLWILQQLIAQWKERGEDAEYETLITAAENAEIDSIIRVDDEVFQSPLNMEKAIADYCILKSLAQRYKQGVTQLNSLLPSPVTQLHIIGGGCRNRLLNRLTEEALGIPVYAGPVEATAIGNILVQALACGEIKTRDEITEII